MKHRTIIIITAAAGVAAIAIGGTAAAGQYGDDNEQSITGEALARATEAALAHTGEGAVTETEVGDEDSYYEVEVTLGSGQQVDVQLDESFAVVGAADDVESGQDD